jgi:hypothetical protein
MTMSDDKIQDEYNLYAEGVSRLWTRGFGEPHGPTAGVVMLVSYKAITAATLALLPRTRDSHLLRDADTVELI